MGSLVAVCTAYALMLPAKTLEQETCQKQAHTHDDSCYRLVEEASTLACQLEQHIHEESCFDETGQVVCGYADFVVHTHDAFCYDEAGALVCTLPEIEAHTHEEACFQTVGHTHGDDCYGERALICDLEETPGHTHDESCFPIPEEPVCGLEEGEEHIHDESCFPVPEEPACGLEDGPGHMHGEECYASEAELICTLEEAQDAELICEKEEVILHTHEESCLDEDGNLICGQCQILAHQHTEACMAQLPLTCEKEEDESHTHGPRCYGTWELSCGLEEHTHTEECYLSSEPGEFTYEDTFFTMSVTVESPEPLPEDMVLCVTDAAEELYDAIPLSIGEDEAMGDGQWILRDVYFLQGEELVDTTGFTMTAQILWKDQPMAATLDPDGEVLSPMVELMAWQVDDAEGLRPIDTTLYTAGQEPAALTGQITTGTLVLRSQNAEEIEYTVQYYGYMLRSTQEGSVSTTLPVIDTSGGVLPKNSQGTNVKTVEMPLTATGGTNQYRVNSVSTLTELYATNTYTYLSAPNVRYLDKLQESTGYTLSEIWILKDGASEDSTQESDWEIYQDISEIHFTSRPEFAEGKDNVICVTTGTVMRLVYQNVNSSFTTSATFYDYDITGQNVNYPPYYNTDRQGINSLGNYNGAASNLLAFGNQNTASGLDDQRSSDGYYMNRANTSGYKYCCFGLVSGLDAEGHIQFTVNAPHLFNDGSANGKTVYENSSLTFERNGDNYTLFSAAVNGQQTVSNLNVFNNPTNGSTTYSNIFTNNFWPMDQVSGADPKFGGATAVEYKGSGGSSGKFPDSDDGIAHNSYFGLQYAVQFTLTEDYIGPLDYVFYGDDDMWVFLDGRLICDIGGVHSSVGEYVNLWDYIAKGTEGSHTLSFFYTERGASGSTCYMSFTLPSVTGVEIEQKSSDLTIGKKVVGESNSEKEFTFQIRFYDANGNAILDDYSYEKFNADGTSSGAKLVLCNGEIFTLKDGQYIIARNLPYGLRYTVEEIELDSYYTPSCTVNGLLQTGGTAKGTVLLNQSNTVWFTNTVESVSLHVTKVGPDGSALAGAVFQLKDASGNVINFQPDVDGGSYTRPNTIGDDVTEGGQYYIALSGNPDYVLGLSGTDVVLRPKDTGQVFTVSRLEDGSYTFLAPGGYLDVYNGDLSNGTKLILWNGADSPNDNEKWFLNRNSDGSLTFRSRKAVLNNSAAVMDLNGATVADGQKIQLYTANDSSAQKWTLVPVGGTSSGALTTQNLTVNDQGQLHLNGLLPGTYTLVEISPPEGYVLSQEIAVSVRVDGSGQIVLLESSDWGTVADNQLRVLNVPGEKTLTLKKLVEGVTTEQSFQFEVSYLPLGQTEPVTLEPVTLKHNESTELTIPYGAAVTIREINAEGFRLSFQNGETSEPAGAIDGSYTFSMKENVTITAVNTGTYRLPATGGMGSHLFYLSGGILVTLAGLYGLRQSRKKKEA